MVICQNNYMLTQKM